MNSLSRPPPTHFDSSAVGSVGRHAVSLRSYVLLQILQKNIGPLDGRLGSPKDGKPDRLDWRGHGDAVDLSVESEERSDEDGHHEDHWYPT